MPIPQLAKKTRSPQNWRRKHVSKMRPSSPVRLKKTWQSGSSRPRRELKVNQQTLREFFAKKNLIKWGIWGLVAFIIIGFITVLVVSRDLPDPNKLIDRQVAESTKIYDRTGENILYEVHGDQKRTLVNLNDIPDYVKKATIAIEDKNFYEHGAFSFWAIFRTAVTNVLFGRKAGGSTLTQQFVKNAILTNEKSYIRKIKELILAYRLEQKFTKDEILQMYLNEIPYGSSAYGVEAASQHYFGKNVKDINLAEAAILAALPQAPSRYSPYGQNKQLLLDRQKYVLDLMVEQGYITNEEAVLAKNTEISFKEQVDDIMAPHFVMYIREMLAEEYGEKNVEQGGFKIITTIDLDKQKLAQEAVKEIGEQNAAKYQANNVALVSLDPKTGQVLAMVGSRDFFNEDIDGQFNVALAPRQPGSSFKPIVYTAAFIKGYTPDTMVYDVVTNFSDSASGSYEPHNYDGREHGPVSFRQALQGSLNIPAVKALYLTGVKNVLSLAEDLGYTTLSPKDADRLGLSLVLGGGEVKLLDHANAFSALAREGLIQDPVFILKIEDKDGKVLQEWEEKPARRVLDANIARMTNNVLSDNAARAYVFGEKNLLTLPGRPVAAKTGTTNDYRDAWTIGYTPSLVTGVWVGNSDNSKMSGGADGSVVAAPIWNRYMRQALEGTPVEGFNTPEYSPDIRPILRGEGFAQKTVKIDKASGLLATEYTPASQTEERTYVQTHCILYYVDKDQPQNFYPKNPESDPQFNLWESRVQAWVAKKQAEDPSFVIDTPPTESDNLHVPANLPTFSIDLKNNQLVTSEYLSLNVQASAPRGVAKVNYYVNDNLFTTSKSFPYGLNRSFAPLSNGVYKLTISVCDDIDNCSSQSFNINLQIPDNNTAKKATVSLAGPANGSSLSAGQFPVTLKANVINPENIAILRFYYSQNDQPQLIGSLQSITSNLESLTWEKAPANGEYQIYVEADNWQSQTASSERAKITIK